MSHISEHDTNKQKSKTGLKLQYKPQRCNCSSCLGEYTVERAPMKVEEGDFYDLLPQVGKMRSYYFHVFK